MFAVGELLKAIYYVDQAISNSVVEPKLVRKNQDNDFSNFNLTNVNSITLNTRAINDSQVITKCYVHQLQQENERFRRDFGSNFYNELSDLVENHQDKNFNDNISTNLDSFTVIKNLVQISTRKFVEKSLGHGNILRFIQRLQNYLKVSVGIDIYNLTKIDRSQFTHTTVINYPNNWGYLLKKWNIKRNDKSFSGKITSFIRWTKTSSPTPNSAAKSLPPIGDNFMYIETTANHYGPKVYWSFERTDNNQNTNIRFYCNHFSAGSRKTMDNSCIRYNIPKNDSYSILSSQWNLVSLIFTVENYGTKLICDEIDSALADISFSNISIPHSEH